MAVAAVGNATRRLWGSDLTWGRPVPLHRRSSSSSNSNGNGNGNGNGKSKSKSNSNISSSISTHVSCTIAIMAAAPVTNSLVGRSSVGYAISAHKVMVHCVYRYLLYVMMGEEGSQITEQVLHVFRSGLVHDAVGRSLPQELRSSIDALGTVRERNRWRTAGNSFLL